MPWTSGCEVKLLVPYYDIHPCTFLLGKYQATSEIPRLYSLLGGDSTTKADPCRYSNANAVGLDSHCILPSGSDWIVPLVTDDNLGVV